MATGNTIGLYGSISNVGGIGVGNTIGLYDGSTVAFPLNYPYGNANVTAFLAIGSDSGNTIGNITATGNIVGNYFLGNGSQLTGLPVQPGTYSNANVANYLPVYSGTILANQISFTNNSGIIEQGDQRITITGNAIGVNTGAYFNDTGEAALFANTYVAIATNTIGNINPTWTFGADGNLNLPGGAVLGNTYGDTANSIGLQAGVGGYAIINSHNQQQYVETDDNTVFIGTNYPAANHTWVFDKDGNLSAPGNISTGANITAGYFVGNGSQLTGIVATSAITALHANVADLANVATFANTAANATYATTAGTANTAVTVTANAQPNITSVGTMTSLTATGNITGNYFIGNGSQLTGITANYGNANVANYLPTFSGNLNPGNVTATGNISGAYILGNGSQLTGLPATYGNANVAAYLPTYTGNLVSLLGNVTTTANVSGAYILGNGSQLTGLPVQPGTYSNANVAAYLPVYSGNLASLTGNVITTANVAANYFLGNGSQLTGMYGNANVASYLPTYTGNLSAGNIAVTGNANVTNDLRVSGTIYGTFSGNISGNLVVPGANTDVLFNNSGNAGASNNLTFNTATNLLTVTGNATATGNITGNYFVGNGSQLTGIVSSYGNSNVAAFLPTYNGNLYPNILFTSLVAYDLSEYISMDGTGIKFTAGLIDRAIIASNGNFNVGNINTGYSGSGNILAAGNVQANYFLGNGSQLTGLPATYGNANVAAYLPTYTGNLNPGNVTATGNISGAYVLGNGSQLTGLPVQPGTYSNANVAAYLPIYSGNLNNIGNITANYFIGDGSQLTNLPVQPGTYSNANVANYLPVFSGNISAGNITVTGIITSNNFVANLTTVVSSASNVALNNSSTYNQLITGSASQNIALPNAQTLTVGITYAINNNSSQPAYIYYYDAVTQLGTIPAGGYTEVILLTNSTTNGTWDRHSVIPSYASWGSSSLAMGGASITNTASVTATGNVTAGNLTTAGQATVTGNITGGNLITGGILSVATTTANSNINNLAFSTPAANVNVIQTQLAYDPTQAFNPGRIIFGTGNVLNGAGNVANSYVGIPALTFPRVTITDSYSMGNVSGQFIESGVAGYVNLTANVTNTGSGMFASYQQLNVNGNAATGATGNTFNLGSPFKSAGLYASINLLGNTTVYGAAGQVNNITVGAYSTANPAYGTVNQFNVGTNATANSIVAFTPVGGGFGTGTVGNYFVFYNPNVTSTVQGSLTNSNTYRGATSYYFLRNDDNLAQTQLGSMRAMHSFAGNTATTTGNVVINKSLGQVLNLVPTGNCTILSNGFSNFVTNTSYPNAVVQGQSDTVTLYIRQPASPFTITMPASAANIKYSNGSNTVANAANSITKITVTASQFASGSDIYLIDISPNYT